MKTWNVKRTIVEEFQVDAETKEEALMVERAPHKITIIKETATIDKEFKFGNPTHPLKK